MSGWPPITATASLQPLTRQFPRQRAEHLARSPVKLKQLFGACLSVFIGERSPVVLVLTLKFVHFPLCILLPHPTTALKAPAFFFQNIVPLTCLLCCGQCRWVFRCPRHHAGLSRSPCSWWWLRAGRSRWRLPCRPTWPCWVGRWCRTSHCRWRCCCCCCCCSPVTDGSNLSWRIYLGETIRRSNVILCTSFLFIDNLDIVKRLPWKTALQYLFLWTMEEMHLAGVYFDEVQLHHHHT